MYPKLTSKTDVLAMLDEMIAYRLKIFDRCAKLSVEQLNDPVYPGTWSVLKNLAHCAAAEQFMLTFIKSRPGAPAKVALEEAPHELAAVRTALDEAHAEAIAFLKANPESVLAEKCVFGRNLVEETVGGVYFHIVEHEIGHRTFVMHKLAKLQGK
jgi:uncharacterized damage-inducible protein DinB